MSDESHSIDEEGQSETEIQQGTGFLTFKSDIYKKFLKVSMSTIKGIW